MPKLSLLDRVRRIALALPDTEESSRLGGEPHFYVRGKIFAGCGVEDGVWSFGVKVGLGLQAEMVSRPGIHVAKYVGRYGWISVEERALVDPIELQELIMLSYDLVSAGAPKKAARKAKPAVRKKVVKKAKPAVRKKAVKKAKPAARKKAKKR